MTLNKLFSPKSVAIIGASENPKKFGNVIIKNYLQLGYKGKIYPINPKAESVLGFKCYKSVLDVPDEIDAAVLVIPGVIANPVVKECVKKGIEYVVMITAGFKEVGAEGIAREKELLNIIKGSKTRVVGPNCVGVYDSYAGIDDLFLPEYKLKRPRAGDIAFISQSGAVAFAMLDWAAYEGIGISRFVSYGNKADLDEIDLLNFLKDDNKTNAIAMYSEGVDKGQEFLKCLKAVTAKKPVIVLKAGKSSRGTSAVQSHTGSLAGSYEVFKGALKQAGAIEAEDTEELFDFARVLAHQPLPKGDRVAIVTGGGGYGVMGADAVEMMGLRFAEFSPETVEIAKNALPKAYSSVHNPLDIIADADVTRYEVTIEAAMRDPNVDAVIAIPLLHTVPLDPNIVDVIARMSQMYDKPIVVSASGGPYVHLLLSSLEKCGIPSYPSVNRAVKAIKALVDYSRR